MDRTNWTAEDFIAESERMREPKEIPVMDDNAIDYIEEEHRARLAERGPTYQPGEED